MLNTEGYDLSGLRGLVVDDSHFMRRIVEQVLVALGVGEVRTAVDGFDAFRRFCEFKPDFIITDWDMGDDDGPSFVHRARMDPHSPNPFVPIIMLTGYAEYNRVLEARDFGITEFVVKPISAGVIYKRLMSLIENPRPFIKSNGGYFGPCRRRATLPDFGGENRRIERPYEVPASAMA